MAQPCVVFDDEDHDIGPTSLALSLNGILDNDTEIALDDFLAACNMAPDEHVKMEPVSPSCSYLQNQPTSVQSQTDSDLSDTFFGDFKDLSDLMTGHDLCEPSFVGLHDVLSSLSPVDEYLNPAACIKFNNTDDNNNNTEVLETQDTKFDVVIPSPEEKLTSEPEDVKVSVVDASFPIIDCATHLAADSVTTVQQNDAPITIDFTTLVAELLVPGTELRSAPIEAQATIGSKRQLQLDVCPVPCKTFNSDCDTSSSTCSSTAPSPSASPTDKATVRRLKNNASSKVSRATRKSKHSELFTKEATLEKENAILRLQIERMTVETSKLRAVLVDKLSTGCAQ